MTPSSPPVFVLDIPSQQVFRPLATQGEIVSHLRGWQSQWQLAGARWHGAQADYARQNDAMLQAIEFDVSRGDFGSLERFAHAAQNNQTVIPAGVIGQYILDEATPESRSMYVIQNFFDSAGYDKNTNPFFNLSPRSDLRSYFMATFPNFLIEGGEARTLYDLTTVGITHLYRAARVAQRVQQLEQDLQASLIEARLRGLMAPVASRWRRDGWMYMLSALVGLLPFLVIVFLPFYYWKSIYETIAEIANPSEDNIHALREWADVLRAAPWTIFAIITAPTLFFAWVLKHFSRIFVSSLEQASDSHRRAAIADVYGRLQSTTTDITDDQKNIIFEAMFKPNVSARDDGVDFATIQQFFNSTKGGD